MSGGWSTVEQEIDRSILELKLDNTAIKKLDPAPATSAEIAEQVRERFVIGNPSFWWDALRVPSKSVVYETEHWRSSLGQQLAAIHDARCWFIPEFKVRPFVYDVALGEGLVELIWISCREYYLASQRFDWLLADTHHNALIMALPEERPAP